jgi:nucleoside-diphosphate-sugar epimerase
MRDADKVERVVRGKDVVFNLAGKSGAADSNKAPLLDLDINCRGHLTILEACREHNPNVSIVFPSSRLVYGKPHYLPVDEKHPLTPESIYAAHKVSVENYHLIYARLYGLTTSILRISNPYGPMQCVDERSYGIANRMIQTAVANKQITLFGQGEQRRDYLYIDDLVDAFLRAGARRGGSPLVCNIGDSRSVSLRELADLAVHTAGGGEIVQVPWPKEYQAIETGDYQSCLERAREILGWEPVVPLAEGIALTVAAC